MAEHDEKLFEHELEEKFRKLDESIKIPEIPDAQSIFEKAENEKTNVVPFKKYSRYIAAAAAVVLVCVSIPFFSAGASAEFAPQEPMSAPNSKFNYTSDSAVAGEMPVETAVGESEIEYNEAAEITDQFDGQEKGNPVEPESPAEPENELYSMLFDFFENGGENEFKESSVASSSVAEPETGGAGDSERKIKNEYDEDGRLSMLSEEINKKRSIEIVIEDDSVSVMLFDTSAGNEVISAFWVEGSYLGAQPGKELYTIRLSKKIGLEDFETGNYIPMAGDPVDGTYFLSEENVSLPNTVRNGEFFITVSIDLKTGDYEIHASLI